MRLIPLTTTNGQFIYVQMRNVLEVLPSWYEAEGSDTARPASMLSYVNGEYRIVRETPDEIVALIYAPEASTHV